MFTWFRSKKKKKNKAMNESIIEQSSEYQWVKGERIGEIVKFKDNTIDDSGEEFVNFTDGSRIRKTLFEEFLIPLEGDMINSEVLGRNFPEAQQDRRSQVGNVSVTPLPGISPRPKASPIRALLDKQKPNWVKINIELDINIPTKELYDILSASFEGADEEIIEFCTEGLEMEDIKKALGITLKEIYTSKKQKKNGEE